MNEEPSTRHKHSDRSRAGPQYQILFRGGVMDGHQALRSTLPEFIDIPIEDVLGGYSAIRYKHAEVLLGTQTAVYEMERMPGASEDAANS
jgi:hypothetical protein